MYSFVRTEISTKNIFCRRDSASVWGFCGYGADGLEKLQLLATYCSGVSVRKERGARARAIRGARGVGGGVSRGGFGGGTGIPLLIVVVSELRSFLRFAAARLGAKLGGRGMLTYHHVSVMLERIGMRWWLAMFDIEIYFDDSGTDAGTPVAVAACYVGQKEQWDHFVRNWNRVREEEGFDIFHMAEFVAKPEMKHEPFCHWDRAKKDRVYAKLASIINARVRHGFAVAVPKQFFDEFVFDEFKQYASNHYVWAVKSVLGSIEQWRRKFGLTIPMQYVFERGALGESQLRRVWDDCLLYAENERRYGIVADGVQFRSKKAFTPLQAADILAWQMQNYMRRCVMNARSIKERRKAHPGFLMLRDNRPMDLMFYSRAQTETAMQRTKAFYERHKIWPWQPEANAYPNVRPLPDEWP